MQSVGEIKEILSSCPVEKLSEVLPEFAADSRKGVQSLVTRFQKKYDAYLAELERLETLLTFTPILTLFFLKSKQNKRSFRGKIFQKNPLDFVDNAASSA